MTRANSFLIVLTVVTAIATVAISLFNNINI